jgi:PAS domain S-box-containing protein
MMSPESLDRSGTTFRLARLLPYLVFVITFTTTAYTGLALYHRLKQSQETAFNQRAESIINTMVHLGGQYIVAFDWPLLEELVQRSKLDPIVNSLTIVDTLSEQTFGDSNIRLRASEKMYTQEITLNGHNVGRVSVVIDETSLNQTLSWLRGSVWFMVAAVVLAINGLVFMLARARLHAREIQLEVKQRREAEASLRKLSMAMEQSPSSVVITDENAVIEYVNPRFLETTGYTAEEVIGQNPRILNSGLTPNETYRELRSKLAAGRDWRGEFHNCKKNGETYWEYASISPIRAVDGAITHFVAVKEDITLRKDYEEKLERTASLQKAKEAAEDASRAKSEFLATMSHELRTPMNGVTGMTELLLDTGLDDQQRGYAETVRHSADALMDIINEILDFSKIEAGRLELESVDFDIRELAEGVTSIFAEQAGKKRLELTCFVSPEIEGLFIGDRLRLRQIMMNLLNNAVKFTFEGEVDMRVKLLWSSGKEARVEIEVRDTGIGIDPSKLEHIFESFSQADGSTTRKYGGTGLGLSIAKSLTEAMGGEIGVKSHSGEGSSFWFRVTLPRSSTVVVERERDLEGMRALVVDDNETNRENLAAYLGSWGIDHCGAESGSEALAVIGRTRAEGASFDVALVDVNMPGMNGIELSRRIRAELGPEVLRIVLLSSTIDLVDDDTRRACGICALLTKPTRLAELRRALATESSEPVGAEMISSRKLSAARVLIAEDSSINQEVASQQLRVMGCQVDVVDNGVAAVRAVAQTAYDLVLMDCQMPEMDGYEATRRIRREEKDNGGSRLPIIALTANAVKGDREACLAAGMDDYIAKPFTQEQLRTVMLRWLPTGKFANDTASKAVGSSKAADTAYPPLLDQDALRSIRELERNGANGMLARVVQMYRASAPQLLSDIRRGVDEGDVDRTRRAAHTLKSSSANLGAMVLASLSKRLEDQARSANMAEVNALAGQIESKLVQTLDALTSEVAREHA